MTGMTLIRSLAVAGAALLAGCSAMLDLHSPARESTADGGTDSSFDHDAAGGSNGPIGYQPAAVRFDPAGSDYMSANGLLGAPTSSQVGTMSVWLHFNGGDGSMQTIAAASVVLSGGVVRASNNKIQFTFFQCNGQPVLTMQTSHTYTSTSGWIHVAAAWDLPNNKAQIYVNGALETSNIGINAGSICYNAPVWYIGGTGGGYLDADVADFFASFDEFIDLGSPSNRGRFRDETTGQPVDLGPECSTAAGGTSPIACFIGPVAGWSHNKGTGGGFALHGAGLAAAPTTP
jgi:hypothetical protein